MKILIFTSLRQDLKTRLKGALPTEKLIFKDDISEEELNAAFGEAEIIFGNPPPALFANKPSKLAFWQLDSVGFDQYKDIRIDIPVANMGDFYAYACAETIVAGVLSFYRGINELTRLQAEKHWKGKEIRKKLQLLGGKNVIILGSGSIGSSVKNLLSAFGCRIRTTARKNPEAQIHSYEELLKALPEADLVVNTLPGTAEKYVSDAFFGAIRKGSVYASVGRGNTTDEAALIKALESGTLAGAVLDVTSVEPLPEHSKLWEMDNVILSQHTGGGWQQEQDGLAEHFIANMGNFKSGNQLLNLISLQKGY